MMPGDWPWSLPQHYWENPKLLDLKIFDDNPLKTLFSSRLLLQILRPPWPRSSNAFGGLKQNGARSCKRCRGQLQCGTSFLTYKSFSVYNLVPCMGLVFGGIDFEWWNWTKVPWRCLKSQTQPEADIRNAEIECKVSVDRKGCCFRTDVGVKIVANWRDRILICSKVHVFSFQACLFVSSNQWNLLEPGATTPSGIGEQCFQVLSSRTRALLQTERSIQWNHTFRDYGRCLGKNGLDFPFQGVVFQALCGWGVRKKLQVKQPKAYAWESV